MKHCHSKERIKTAFIQSIILMLISFDFGCGFDYSHYFSKMATPATIQIGVNPASGNSAQSFDAVNNYDFGQQPFGSNTTKTFYLTNIGESEGSNLVFYIDSEYYTIQTSCKTLKPISFGGSSCPLSITFSPTSFDSLPAHLSYSYNDSKGKHIQTVVSLTAISMRWAFLKFTAPTGTTTTASSSQAQPLIIHVSYSGDLLKTQDQTSQNTIPPASWSGASAMQVTTTSAQLTTPNQQSFAPSSSFYLDPVATAAYPTGCVSPITKGCDLVVQFKPSFSGVSANSNNAGDFSGEIGLHYFNGHSASAYAGTSFKAHGLSSGNLAAYSINNVSVGTVAYNPTQPLTLTVQISNPNFSTVPGTQTAITLPTNPVYVQSSADLAASTCKNGGQIPTSGCSIQLTFNPQFRVMPTGITVFPGTLTVSYSLGGKNLTLTSTLTGTGAPPAKLIFSDGNGNPLSYSPTPLNFALFSGAVPAFYPYVQTILVRNIGGVSTQVTNTNLGSDKSFTNNSGCNGNTVAASGTCQITVTFTPPDTGIQHSGSLQLTYPSGSTSVTSAPLLAAFSGTGSPATFIVPQGGTQPQTQTQMGSLVSIGSAVLAKNVGTYVYGSSGGTTGNINLNIYGTNPLPNGLSAPASGNGFTLSSNTCFNKAISAPNGSPASCTFTIGYHPPGSGNSVLSASQNFTSNYTDSVGNTGSLQILATAIAAPPPNVHFAVLGTTAGDASGSYSISTSSSPILYGQAATSINLTLWNDSPYFAVPLVSPTIQGNPSRFSVSSTGCGNQISAGGNCSYQVKFAPQSTDNGSYSDTIQFKYTNLSNGAQTSWLTQSIGAYVAAMINPQPASNPGNINFNTVYAGSSASASLSFTPIGYVSTQPWWMSLGSLPSKVSVTSNTCTSNTGSGTPCMITFTYSPVAATDSIASGASTNLTYQQTNQTQATVPIHFSANLQSTSAKLSIGGTNFSQTYNVSPDPFYPTSSSGIVALTNNSVSPGGAIANYISAALTSTDGSFTLNPDTSDTSNCTYGKSLGMTGGYCDIRVHFSPKSVGPINATLTVTYFDLGLNQNVVQTSTLSGMGTVPIHVFAGGGVSCITDETEQAVCWGDNTYGQLGQGNNGSWNMSPQKMPKINFGASVQVLQLAVSAQHVCAIVNTPTVKGAVTCWGSNDSGRLGLGLGNSGQLDSPTSSGNLKIVDLVDSTGNPEVATQISAGYGHVCALFKDQTMKCWGLNSSYQLGNNNTNNIGSSLSQMGIQLSHINLGGPIASIAAGTAHTCATLVNGSTYCWGDNGYGELGQGMNNLTLASPALVKMGTHPSVVSAHLATNSAMTCLLLTDGTSTCFGQSSYSDGNQTFNGTLGICMARQNNDYTQPASLCWNSPSLVPTDKYGVLGSDVGSNLSLLPFSTPISKMTVGGQHGCVLFNTGSNGACWGSNSNGQLGNGNTSSVGAGKNDLNSSLVHSFSPVPGHTPTEIAAGVLHSCAVFTDNSVKCWGEGTIDNANGMGADTSAIADQLSPVYIGSSI